MPGVDFLARRGRKAALLLSTALAQTAASPAAWAGPTRATAAPAQASGRIAVLAPLLPASAGALSEPGILPGSPASGPGLAEIASPPVLLPALDSPPAAADLPSPSTALEPPLAAVPLEAPASSPGERAPADIPRRGGSLESTDPEPSRADPAAAPRHAGAPADDGSPLAADWRAFSTRPEDSSPFEGTRRRAASSAELPALPSPVSLRAALQAPRRSGPEARTSPDEPAAPVPAGDGWLSLLRDKLLYYRMVLNSLWWYTFPRLQERWNELRHSLAATEGRPRSVRDLRGFFIAHRVLGSTGSYSPMGFRVAANGIVVEDAWHIFRKYFRAPTAASEAFARLLERARRFNAHQRSTQFRKIVFHALREASVLPPEELAAFFDTQAGETAARALAEFQASRQGEIVARLEEVVRRTLTELEAEIPAGRRIVGAILLGSFASGGAGPESDLDIQAVTEDGSSRYMELFNRRLKERWKETGITNPLSGFQYSLRFSRNLVTMTHPEAYLVISPYPGVREALSRPEGLPPPRPPRMTAHGRLFQAFYTRLLHLLLRLYDKG